MPHPLQVAVFLRLNRTTTVLLGLLLAIVSNALAQPTLTVGTNTRVVGTGDAQFVYGGGSLTNNGSLSLAAGQLSANGPSTYGGSGAATVANISFGHSTGTSTLNSLLSVTNRATLSANTALNTNGQLYLRTDQFPNTDLVNNGILTGTVQGLVTRGTVLTGNTPYSSLLSTNVSGTSARYQWQSSADNSAWADIAGATSPTYTASVSATTYYRCRLTTSNSSYNQTTPALLLNVTGAPPQPIRYVTQNGTGDGSSWASASGNLQAMIDAPGVEQVWVAVGTYKPTTGTDRSVSFAMKNNVAIYGGFVGTEANLTDRPAVNPILGTPSSTTLSGDIGTPGNNSDNSYHVISNDGNSLDNKAVLDGMVITGGNANGPVTGTDSNGGGIYNSSSSPTITNCSLFNNSASSNGGGIGNFNSSSPIITNCSLQTNSALNGGGVFNSDGSPTFTNCSLFNNSASSKGGGIYSTFSSPILASCSLINNSAANGGGIANEFNGNLTLVNCSLQNNSATNGGGIYNMASNPMLTNCSLLNNAATVDGGGIYNTGVSNPILANCVLWGNGANKTIYNDTGGDGSPSALTATYSLFDNTVTGYTGTNNLTTTTSPFVSATPGTTDAVALAPNSPAINAGSNAAYDKGPKTDLVGNPRIFPTGGTIDMGAIELQSTPVTALNLTFTASPDKILTTGTTTLLATVSGGTTPYSYTFAGPGTITASGNTASVSGLTAGVQTFTLTARDATTPTSQTISATVSVTVTQANTAPVATANINQTATVGTAFTYTVNAFTDTETPGELTYQATIDPANGLNFNPATRVVSGTPINAGVVSVTVVATDPGGLSASTSFTITVNPAPLPAQPIRYVTQNGTGDGSSWASASGDLQTMIDAPGVEQVWVAGGTFKPSVTGLSNARTASFVMKNNVAIYGGFFGTEANLTDRPAVNPILGTPSSTTLSGDIGTPGNNSDNSYHVFYNIDNGLTSTAILDGVVITGGNASGGGNIGTSNAGGGMYIRRSSPTLINCVLANNSAANGGGGGIYITSGNNTTLTNCLLVNNSAQRGGGIFNFSSITLTNCKLINNSATFADGGGLNGGAPTLINCSLINNSAIGNGGGVYGLSPVLVNCSLQANSATNGGGIYNNGSPTLTNCSLLSNSAITGGGIYNNGTPTLANCVLWDNGAGNTIVNNSPATLTATYSLFDNTVTGYTGSNNKTTNTSPFASATDVTLAPNSPAIDAGSNAAYEKGPATDLAGNPRIFPAGGTIDMGAIEYQGSPVQPVAITSQPPSASSVTAGASVSAPASVMGSVSGYQWYKDNLSNAVAGQTSATLTLTNVQLADAGSYSLVVTGTYNSVTSTAFNLSVIPAVTGVPSLSSPANGTTTNGLPTFAGSAPGGSTVMVYLSGTASQTLTTTANGGQFSVTPDSPLSSGSYSAYAVAISSGQTTSPASNTNAFSVDATAPAVTLSASVGNGATTSSQPTSFTAQFSEPVTGFDVSKVSVSNGSVNGFSGSGASYSFSVTASTPGQPTNVSIPANVAQDGVGNSNTASDSYGFTVTPGDFAIRSVDTRQCQLVDASRGEYRVSFTPIYSGLNGTPVSLRVINEVDATTAPGPYTIRLYSDNPTVTLLAQQAASPDARFSYAWLAACQGSVAPNRPPTTTGIPPQQLVQNQPYQLELTRYFADPDGQTLTYSSSALPAGLTLAGTTISGSPTAPGRTTVRITALDPGGLSVATDVAMQVDATPATTPPAGFTITGVTDLTCVAVTATERRVSFSPVYSGLDGSSVRFRAVNEQDFGTTPGPYSLRLYTDNPAVTLEAVQTGQTATYRYNWLSACGNQTPPTVTNRPPVVVVPIAPQSATVGQGYSFYVPVNTFADPEGEPLSLRTGALPAGLSFSSSLSAITGTPAQAGTSTIELTASDPAGQSVSLNFTLQVVAGAATTPPTPPAGFTITGVGSVTCLSVSNTERRLSFFPQYTGVDGSPIRFRVVNEQDFGTTPGPYSLRLYTDNPAVTLEAVQTGQTATYRYNWLAACTSPANSRQAVAEASSPLSVVVLGNPVVGESVEVLIGGVAGQAVELNLTDLAGDRLHQQQIPQASGSARVVIPVPAGQAMTILKVSTATQQQTVKLIRH